MRRARSLLFASLGLLCLVAARTPGPKPAPVRHVGEPRAWALLEKATAWSDSMLSPRRSVWLEFRAMMACGPPARGAREMVVRIARAADKRVACDVWFEPGPSGLRVRHDGRRQLEHSLWGGIYTVTEAPPESAKLVINDRVGFVMGLALGRFVTEYQRDSVVGARCVGSADLAVDGQVRRCERVRVGPDPRRLVPAAEEYWIDAETGCPWRMFVVDLFERPVPETAMGYAFVRMGVPPDSCFDTTVPAGARVITGNLESTRPRPQVAPALEPRIQPGGLATFRWSGEARSVALVGSFNCWDPRADPMTRGDYGVWTRTRSVDTKMFNDYLFLVDGTRFVMDPFNPGCRGDGLGGWVSCLVSRPAPGK